jgi:hypothetical protein
MSAAVESLARILAEGIAKAARDIAREEGRRAALEVLDSTGARRLEREWVSQVQAAGIAGVTPQTVREWLRAGLLGEAGRRGRVNLERLRAHLAGNQQAGPGGRGRQIAAAALAVGRDRA